MILIGEHDVLVADVADRVVADGRRSAKRTERMDRPTAVRDDATATAIEGAVGSRRRDVTPRGVVDRSTDIRTDERSIDRSVASSSRRRSSRVARKAHLARERPTVGVVVMRLVLERVLHPRVLRRDLHRRLQLAQRFVDVQERRRDDDVDVVSDVAAVQRLDERGHGGAIAVALPVPADDEPPGAFADDLQSPAIARVTRGPETPSGQRREGSRRGAYPARQRGRGEADHRGRGVRGVSTFSSPKY